MQLVVEVNKGIKISGIGFWQRWTLKIIVVIFILTSSNLFLSHAAETVYCMECRQSFTLEDEDDEMEHPDNGCSYAGDVVTLNATFITTESTEEDESDGDAEDEAEEMAFGEEFIRNMMDAIFQMDSEEQDPETPAFTSAEYLLGLSFEMLAGDDGLIDLIIGHDGYKFLVAACFLIMLIRFLSDYAMEKVWDVDKQTPEMLFKPIFKLIAAMVFVLSLPWFFKFALYLSQGAFQVFSNISDNTSGTNLEEVLNTAKDNMIDALGFEAGGISKLPQNIGALICGVITLIIPYAITLIGGVGTFFVIFSRILEIGVHLSLAPLSMTDLYKGTNQSKGINYLYEFFGLCFQSVAIMVVYVASNLVTAKLLEVLTDVFMEQAGAGIAGIAQVATSLAAINLAKLVLMLGTASKAKKAFGGG